MPTIVDVAKAAGVSIAAVSLALSDPQTNRVGAEKRKKILAEAKRLGYTPNVLARGLHNLGTRILGLVVPMRDPIFFNQFIAEVLGGVQQCLIERGYHLMIYSHAEAHGRITSHELIQSKGTDGLIFINTRVCTPDDIRGTVQELQGARVPFVMINGAQELAGINYAGVDDYQLGVTAARYLASQGHTRIGILNGPQTSPSTRFMLDGFRGALGEAGLAFRPSWSVFGNYEREQTRTAIRSIVKKAARPTALYCTSDQMVPDVYEVLRELQVAIPEDMAILGRGDLIYSRYLHPALTTIRVPMRTIGYEAARILIEQLKTPSRAPERLLLAGEVCRRESA